MEHDRIPGGRAATRDATLRDLLNAWFEHGTMSWSPATTAGYVSRIKIIAKSPLGATCLDELTTERLDRWYAALVGTGQSPANIKNHHSLIRRACHQGVKWGWLETNPATMATAPRVLRPQVQAMRSDEVAAVLAAAAAISARAGLALRLAAVTGARRGELAGLRWDDVDGDVLTIARSITIIPADKATDRPNREMFAGPTKTHATRRLTLDPTTLNLIRARRVECEATCAGLGVALGPWMLSEDPMNAEPASPEGLSRLWRRCRKSAGIDVHWRLHDLRHWAATSMVAGGEDIRLVAGRLGHARPATTLDVYAHFIERGDERAATKLSELLGPDPAQAADQIDAARRAGQPERAKPKGTSRGGRHSRASRSKHRPN